MNNIDHPQKSGQRRTAIAVAAILVLGAAAAAAILWDTTPASSSGHDAHGHDKPVANANAGKQADDHGHGTEKGHDHGAEPSASHQHGKSEGKSSTAAHADDDHNHEQGHDSGHPHGAAQAHEDNEIHMTAERAQSAGIKLQKSATLPIGSSLRLPGEIRLNEDRTAHVVPRVAGVAESVTANLGQSVKKGQVLAVLSSPSVSEQRSELLAAQRRLGLARATYQREKQLWQEKISAEQDYQQAQQALREAEINVANAQQKLQAIGAGMGGSASGSAALNRFELRAPFDGIVVEKHLSVGEAVQDSTAVFTISDLRSVWAEMKVTAADLPQVRVGEPARVRATAFDSSADGTVAYVGALIGQETRTAPARITLDNPEGVWRPGLFVEIELITRSQNAAVAVRSSAVHKLDGKQNVVFTPTKEGFKAQPVQLGRSDSRHSEILEGLSAGQSYVSEGGFVLKSELGKATAEHVH